MFRSLLRTIPSLSGNLTLACKIDDINNIDNESYDSYVRNAIIIPLQNKYYSKKIDINMYRGKWESDVSRYFLYYSDNFYGENFNYLKDDYKFIDLATNENTDSRNKDYEFGCKRVNYNKLGYQFQFYAPFYIDNADSFPEYFKIFVKLTPTITKTIKIYIGKNNAKNYIFNYLNNFVKQIDNTIIHINQYNALGTYYGIDVKNGGFAKEKYSLADLMDKHIFVSKFDEFVNAGFKNTNLVMKQVIPLSLLFNIDDILTEKERKFFHYNKCTISGAYYNKFDKKLKMYDFDVDYTNTQILVNKYNSTKYQKRFVTSENVFGVTGSRYNHFLNENNNTATKLTNKVTPMFNKWKLLGSSDKYPYIINNSPNFILQNPSYKTLTYHEFPINIDEFDVKAIVENDNLLLPVNKTYYNKYNKDNDGNTIIDNSINKNLEIYLMAFENINNIFNIIDTGDITENELKNKDLWTEVYNKTSFNHNILYNFESNDELSKLSFDRFGVFMNLIITTNPNLLKSKYVVEFNNSKISNVYVNNNIYSLNPSNIYNFTAGIKNNAYVYEDETFIVDNYDGNYIENDKIETSNQFVVWKNDDTLIKLSSYKEILWNDKGDTPYNSFSLNERKTGYYDIKLDKNDKMTGYVLLDITQYDILQLAYAYKRRISLSSSSIDPYEKFIVLNGDNLYISVFNNSSKIHIKNMFDKIIDKFEIINNNIKQSIKNNPEYSEWILSDNTDTDAELNEIIENIFKQNINSSVHFNTYLKSDNIVSIETLKGLICSSYVNSLILDGMNLDEANSAENPYRLDNTVQNEISANVYEKQKNILKEIEDMTKYEYVPINNDASNIKGEYFIEYKDESNKVYCDYTNIVEISASEQDYDEIRRSALYDDKTGEFIPPHIALIKCTNKDQIECYVEHILKYMNLSGSRPIQDIEKIDSIFYIDKVIYINKDTGLLKYKYQINPIRDINLIPSDENPLCERDNENNLVYRWSIVRDLIEHQLKLHPDNLYFQHYVYDLTPSRKKILEENLDMSGEHSFFLYSSDEEFNINFGIHNKIIIGHESIENNYKDTLSNHKSVENYLKLTDITESGTIIKGYDHKYVVYLDNFKDYEWDGMTPLSEHMKDYISNMSLYKIMREKIFNFISNHITKEDIDINFQYISEEILNNIMSNSKSNKELRNALLTLTTIGESLKDKQWSLYQQENEKNKNFSVFNVEDIANIISYVKLYDSNYDKASDLIYQVIDERLMEICMNVLERQYNGISLSDATIEEKYRINHIKFGYLLEYIIELEILKKYNANKIINSKFNIIEYRGLKYFYILFDFIVDNRVSSYNIGTNTVSSLFINYINGEKFDMHSFKKYFEYILPIYKSNIINTYLNAFKDIIVIPKNNVLKNNTILKSINDDEIKHNFDSIGFGDEEHIWSSTYLKDTTVSRYSINRYFGYIVPIFKEITDSIKNVFSLKYKNIVSNINSDILYKSDINIYKYNPLRIYTINKRGKVTYTNKEQYEYKHFNENVLYNLEPEFRISDIELYTYDELITKENSELSYEKFKEYICDKIKYVTQNSIDKDILLFLFNKYQVTYDSKFEKFDVSNSVKLYRLTYIYKLI